MITSRILIIFLSLSTLLVFTRLALISFIVFLFVLAGHTFFTRNSSILRLVWAYLVFSVLLAIVYMFAWLIEVPLSPTLILILMGSITWFIAIAQPGKARVKALKTDDKGSWSVVAALIICIFVGLPLVRNFSAETVLRYAAKTGDDINHIAIIEANRKTSGYLYSSNEKYSTIIKPNYISYPQGWHINGAFLETLIVRMIADDSMAVRLSSYLFYKMLWLFISVFFLCELLFSAAKLLALRLSREITVMLWSSSMALSVYLLVPLFGYGFQTYVANLALMFAAFSIAFKYIRTNKHVKNNTYLLTLGLLTVGATYVWLLAGLTIGLLMISILAGEIMRDRNYFKGTALWQWAALFGLGILAALQVYIQLKHGPSGGVSSLNLGGVITPISMIGVIATLIIVILLIVRYIPKFSAWLALFMAVASVEYLAISIYQQVAFGEQRYYALKLAYSVALVSLATLLSIIVYKLSSLKWKVWLKATAVLVLISLIPLVLGLNIRKSAYPLKDGTPIKHPTAHYLLTLPDGNYSTVVNTNSKEESFLATKLLSSTWSFSSKEREDLLDRMDWEINH